MNVDDASASTGGDGCFISEEQCFISRLCWMFDGRMTDWLTDISYKIQHFSLYVVTWN